METKQETTLCDTKLNIAGIAFTKAIQEEIDKLSVENVSEYTLCQTIGYEEGLKKALELFVKVKNEQ